MSEEFKKNLGLAVFIAICAYFLFIHGFIKYSLGIHCDNLNNVVLCQMVAKGINPNTFAFTKPDELELYNMSPLNYLAYKVFYKTMESPVVALALNNYIQILLALFCLYFFTNLLFNRRIAVFSVISLMFSVWFILVMRLNFTAYIGVCFFSMLLLFLYWQTINTKSLKLLFGVYATIVLGLLLSTAIFFVVVGFVIIYSFINKQARSFIFEPKTIIFSLITALFFIILLGLISKFLGLEGNILRNYFSYYIHKRFIERGDGSQVISRLEHAKLLWMLVTDYYRQICYIWRFTPIETKPIQLLNPIFIVTGLSGAVMAIFSKNRCQRYLALFFFYACLILTFLLLPSANYWVIVLPVFFLLSSIFINKLLELLPFKKTANKNRVLVGTIVLIILLGYIDIKNNYLPYNKIINNYQIGAADRTRHGIEDIRQFIAKKTKRVETLYVSYNVFTLSDINNFYGVNYSPKLKRLGTENFFSLLDQTISEKLKADMNKEEYIKPNKTGFVFIINYGHAWDIEMAGYFKSIGLEPQKKLYDIANFNYANIYYYES